MSGRLLTLGLLALAGLSAWAWWLQREAAAALRDEIVLGREQRDDLARVRAQNARLRAAQIPVDELARLRADHAAVLRLHQEIEGLKEGLEKRERALASVPSATPGAAMNTAAYREEKIRRENEARQQAVAAIRAAQEKRKKEMLEREVGEPK